MSCANKRRQATQNARACYGRYISKKKLMAYLFLGVGALLLFAPSYKNATTGMHEAVVAFGVTELLLLVFSATYIFAIKPENEKLSRDRILELLKFNEAKVLSRRME